MDTRLNRKIELLSPGGDADSVKAAICAGADAVYCGTGSFNARQRASNLTVEEIGQLSQMAQSRGCRLYLTLNTLVFDHEIPQILDLLEKVYRAGIRVVIVQDLGLLHILKEHFPEIEVHASTQMTTHNEGQISFLSRFGVSQVNLSRELSVSEIKPLCGVAHELGIKVEVFVHGAFCVSFSGQCYLSSDMCGESGNRGACVQPCRRQYASLNPKNGGEPRAVFNLKDNFVFSKADALYDAGVDSFKIEGRIKKFPYVYNVTSAWREQVDALEACKPIRSEDTRLESVFNRNFTAGYVTGNIGSDMFIDSSRDQSLKLVANVAGYWADRKILTLDRRVDLAPDTEILIYTSDFTFICKGVLKEKISPREYQFFIEHKLKGLIKDGYQVFTQELSADADGIKAVIDKLEWTKVPLTIKVSGGVGSQLEAVFATKDKSTTVRSLMPLSAATQRPLDSEILNSQFSRLGTSPFFLDKLDISGLGAGCFITPKELNRMRREAVENLSEMTLDSSRFTIPLIEHSSSSNRKIKRAVFVDTIEGGFRQEKSGGETFLIIPNSIRDVAATAAMINDNRGVTPFFSSILIGDDFSKALELLHSLDGRPIATDNSGIADAASRSGIAWIAGPGFNIVNSYAIEGLLSVKGFSGLFLSPEFPKKETGAVNVPPHIDLWQAVNFRRALMTTRQCLIRNISGCAKVRCDDDCIARCDRSEAVVTSQGRRFRVVKRPGFYTVVVN